MSENQRNFIKGMISLIRSAIEAVPAVLSEDFDWSEAVKTAEYQGIAAVIYYGAYKSKIQLPDNIETQFKQKTYEAIVVDECQAEEINRLCNEFSTRGIDYMPLKGILMKRLYPSPEMRFMGDGDILIRTERYDGISSIMREFGYTENLESDHEYIWSKPPYIIIELHKRIIPSYNKDYYAYYGDGWRLAQKLSKNNSCWEMSAEDELIYMFAHFSKHFRDSGIGIKHMIDFQVFRNKHPELKQEYVQRELKKLRLNIFYQNISETLAVWFDNAPSSDMTDYITGRIFASGQFGQYEERLLASAVKGIKSGITAKSYRRRKFLKAVFSPSYLFTEYPLLARIPVLIPLFWIKRVFTVLFFHRDKIKRKWKELISTSDERIEQYQNELTYVGLDFRFSEDKRR